MVSLTNLKSPSGARDYYQAAAVQEGPANYYSEDRHLTGEWLGSGAAALGLAGAAVEYDQLEAALAGQVPGTDQVIQPGPAGHRPGMDLTFSAPKSVSVAVAMTQPDTAEKIQDAHDYAVRTAVSYVEQHLARIRTTQAGKTQTVSSGNIVAARFDHGTSREQDPQLHSHIVILNMSQNQTTGKWQAIANEEIYHHRNDIGQVYRSELRHQLEARGIATITTDARHGFFEIAGVPDKLIKEFSQRAAQVEQKAQELEARMPRANPGKIREMAALDSRRQKENVSWDELHRDWERRLSASGWNRTKLDRHIAEQPQYALANTARDAVNAALREGLEKESVLNRAQVIAAAAKVDEGRHTIEEIERTLLELEDKGIVKSLGQDRITTAEMQRVEAQNIELMQAGQGRMGSIASKEDVKKLLTQHTYFTAGQKQAVEHILTSQDQHIAVQGNAGTGKTAMMRAVASYAEQKGIEIRGLAYTGKAAAELAETLGKGQTIHSFLRAVDRAEKAQAQTTQQDYQQVVGKFSDREIKRARQMQGATARQKLNELNSLTGRAKLAVMGCQTLVRRNADGGYTYFVQSGSSRAARSLADSVRNKIQQLTYRRSWSAARDVFIEHPDGSVSYSREKVRWTVDSAGRKTTESYQLRSNGDVKVYKSQVHHSNTGAGTRRTIEKNQIVINPQGRIRTGGIWVVDEASFVGARQANALMKAAEKYGAKVVWMGDERQLQGVSAGRTFSNFQKAGIATARMKEVVRQKDPGLAGVVKQIAHGRIRDAFDRLDRAGKIQEVKSRDEALQAAARQWEKGRVILVNNNQDRSDLNDLVRVQRKSELGRDHLFQVMRPTPAGIERHVAAAYRAGQEVRVTRGGAGVQAGTEATITRVNPEKNSVEISFVQKNGYYRSVEIDVMRHGNKIQGYHTETKAFAAGDRIVFLQNNRKIGVRNGQTAEIKEIQGQEIRVQMDHGAEKTINAREYKSFDHGYALTVHKAQGLTAEKATFCDTGRGTSANTFYVAASRAKTDYQIVTTDKAKLAQEVQQDQTKESTLDYHQQDRQGEKGQEKEQEQDRQGEKGQEKEQEQDRQGEKGQEQEQDRQGEKEQEQEQEQDRQGEKEQEQEHEDEIEP